MNGSVDLHSRAWYGTGLTIHLFHNREPSLSFSMTSWIEIIIWFSSIYDSVIAAVVTWEKENTNDR